MIRRAIFAVILTGLLLVGGGYWLWHHFTGKTTSLTGISHDINRLRSVPGQAKQALAGTHAKTDLNLGWSAASDSVKHHRFPTHLAQAMQVHEPVLRHDIHTIGQASQIRAKNQLYLISSRSGAQHVMLAERASNGQLWVLTGRPGGHPTITDTSHR